MQNNNETENFAWKVTRNVLGEGSGAAASAMLRMCVPWDLQGEGNHGSYPILFPYFPASLYNFGLFGMFYEGQLLCLCRILGTFYSGIIRVTAYANFYNKPYKKDRV